MPAGIKEAYRSPFSKSNPASQFYDLNSFTKSSHTDSIRNEYFQSQLDFNNQYQLGALPNYNPSNSNQMNNNPNFNSNQINNNPSFNSSAENPLMALNSEKYPTLQPFGANPYRQFPGQDTNSNDTESLRKDPHQGAGWATTNLPPYIKELPPANVGSFGQNRVLPRSSANYETFSNPPASSENNRPSRQFDQEMDDDNDLIDRVLTNKKYRKLLRRLLIENDDDDDDYEPSPRPRPRPRPRQKPAKQKPRSVIENFVGDTDPNETMRMIAIYGLGGILILCLLDLLVKLGQVLGRRG